MGSILGTMLWKTCKTADVVDIFIQTGTLREFLLMTNSILESFVDTYRETLPPIESYEFKYVTAITGTFVNISAQTLGREFILEDQTGLSAIQTVLSSINQIQMPEGHILKR